MQPTPHFPRWVELMERGEAINSMARALPADEREAFALIDCLSIMAVPVFVDSVWWGYIGFEDCERERNWSTAETDALRAAAGLVAAAISRERAERDLRRRDGILDAVSRSAQRLLAAPNWRNEANDLLARLGVAAEASRAYIFEHRVRTDGAPVAVPRFEWVADGIAPEIDEPLLQEVCFAENGLGRHWEMLNRNEAVAGNVPDFPEEERALISSQDILSIINLPIFVGDDCWGLIGLDDCVSQRDWSAAETDALRETILLVEDEDVVRDLTRRVLERQGYTVLACADGEEAIDLAERDDRTIHLLLTDVVMPGLRGYEVARQVSASRPAIKILYMSGYAEEALVGRPVLESALIEKRFAVDALACRVRETLEAA